MRVRTRQSPVYSLWPHFVCDLFAKPVERKDAKEQREEWDALPSTTFQETPSTEGNSYQMMKAQTLLTQQVFTLRN